MATVDGRFLVTGAAGFIGMHVSAELLRRGATVVGVDSLSDYYSVELKKARIGSLQVHERFFFEKIDLSDYDGTSRIFQRYQPTYVCHLAAQPGVRYSFINPFAYERDNTDGFLKVLELAKANNVPRFVYASSSSVYGGNTKLPFSESDPVGTPISLYAATKRSNELIAHCYAHNFDIQTIGLRFFTVYGPWGRPDMALWLFTDAISNDRPIKVFNNGNMERDFTYIDDICDGVVAALLTPELPKNVVMNLGNHRSERLLDLIETIEKTLGKEAKKEFLPLQPGDMQRTYADTSLAQSLLGFEPSTTIAEGVPRFVEWYKSHPELVSAEFSPSSIP